MSDNITLTIDEQKLEVPEGTTILKAAQSIGLNLPTICYHEACSSNGLCRICVVEVEGSRTLVPSCVAQVSQGMVVRTHTTRVERSRRTILELLASTVDLSDAPEIQDMIEAYAADRERYPEARDRLVPLKDDNPMYLRDYSKCILCWRCVQVCAEDAQYAFAINFSGRGFETLISTYFDKPLTASTCVFCGQCVGVCPTGALKSKREWLLEKEFSMTQVLDATRPEGKKKC